jgi:hypothetical protein
VIKSYAGDSPFPLVPGTDYSQRNFPTLAATTLELGSRARKQIFPKDR